MHILGYITEIMVIVLIYIIHNELSLKLFDKITDSGNCLNIIINSKTEMINFSNALICKVRTLNAD